MRPAIRLYLDHADLCAMADGRVAQHEDALRAAIEDTGTHVVYSDAHTFDLVGSDDETVDRWCRLVERLGPAFRIRFVSTEIEISPLDLVETRAEWQQIRAFWTPLKDYAHRLGVAGHETFKSMEAQLKGKSLRALAEQVFALTPEQSIALCGFDINAACAALGVSRADALNTIANDSKALVENRGVVEAIDARMLTDHARKPRQSDIVDRQHIRFLPHVDLFTADRYTVSQIKPFHGERVHCPIPTASGMSTVLPTAHLDLVAAHLRALYDDLADEKAG